MWVVLNLRYGRIEKGSDILSTFLESYHCLRVQQHGSLALPHQSLGHPLLVAGQTLASPFQIQFLKMGSRGRREPAGAGRFP